MRGGSRSSGYSRTLGCPRGVDPTTKTMIRSAASSRCRREQLVVWSRASSPADHLGEVPLVSLRIGAAVAAVTERQVVELLDDPRARVLRALVVRIDVVDEDEDLGGPPDLRGI